MYNFIIVGYGEIARKAHTPAILQRKEECQIVAIVDVREKHEMMLPSDILLKPLYKSLQDAVINHSECNVASICTPQKFTMDLAVEAVNLGLHVLLEKPPGDFRRLPRLLEASKKHCPSLTVFTAYHSSAPPGLPHIQAWIQEHLDDISHIAIEWKENVQRWHPGQQWVTTREGMGVLDILFNPLSLLVHVLPSELTLVDATLNRPSNWAAPIAGTATLKASKIPISVEFAWDYVADAKKNEPEEVWNITMTTATSKMRIEDGGAQVYIDDHKVTTEPTAEYMIGPEYVNLYGIFVNLMKEGRSYVDATTPGLIQEILDRATWEEDSGYKV